VYSHFSISDILKAERAQINALSLDQLENMGEALLDFGAIAS